MSTSQSPQASQAASQPNLPANLAAAAQRINGELVRRPQNPISLSTQAQTELEVLHAEYLGDLGQEAVRLARQDRLATVDREHVLQAAKRLGAGKADSGKAGAFSTVGGLIAGAGLAGVYQIMFGPGSHTTSEFLVVIALSVVGFILLSLGLAFSLIKRR